jgi:hypothetical protein
MPRPANYIPVSRAQIMSFLERAILDAAQRGFDLESGFKVVKAAVTEDTQSVRVDLDNTDFFFIDIEHLVPRGDF